MLPRIIMVLSASAKLAKARDIRPCQGCGATLPADTFGRISAPCLPQAVQTKSGSTSDNLMLSGQRSALNVVEWLHR